MYVVNWTKAANSSNLADELEGKQGTGAGDSSGVDLPPAAAKEILNPIRCDLMFGQNVIDVES